MIVNTVRSIEPYKFRYEIEFTSADLDAAFTSQEDPNEDLFYALFSPAWVGLTEEAQLVDLAALAHLVEGSQARRLTATATLVAKEGSSNG